MEKVWHLINKSKYKTAYGYIMQAGEGMIANVDEKNASLFTIFCHLSLFELASKLDLSGLGTILTEKQAGKDALDFYARYLQCKSTPAANPSINGHSLHEILSGLGQWRMKMAHDVGVPSASLFGAWRFRESTDFERSTYTVLHEWHPYYGHGRSSVLAAAERVRNTSETILTVDNGAFLCYVEGGAIDEIVKRSGERFFSRGDEQSQTEMTCVVCEAVWKLEQLCRDPDLCSFEPLFYSNVDEYISWFEKSRRLCCLFLVREGIAITHYVWMLGESGAGAVYVQHPGHSAFQQVYLDVCSMWDKYIQSHQNHDADAVKILFYLSHLVPFHRGSASCVERLMIHISSSLGPTFDATKLSSCGSQFLFHPFLSDWVERCIKTNVEH
eukprot:TRINITY_DN7817_c0_g1_i1.p1 TRINITY_DN7817_c0_g1~~TRINITY_DN7817_c0_g1_i1.p1  ORF type:complete len:385 (-),score=60.77 TRINITY_DN7817_c0_g1_i1:3-1157(-)